MYFRNILSLNYRRHFCKSAKNVSEHMHGVLRAVHTKGLRMDAQIRKKR